MFVQLSLSEWKEKLRCGASGRNTTEDILWTQKPEIQNSWQSHPVLMRYFSPDHMALQRPDNHVYLQFPNWTMEMMSWTYKLRDVTLDYIITFKVVNLNRLFCVWPLKKNICRNLWFKQLKRLLPRGEIRGLDQLRASLTRCFTGFRSRNNNFQTTNFCVAPYYISISKHHQ